MTNNFDCVVSLSDDRLVAEIKALAAHERDVTARLIAALAELDERRLYLGAGCPSLFVYCTRVLRLSEHAAYGRIEAARASRRFPRILDLLTDGSLTLTAVCLLRPLLNDSTPIVCSTQLGTRASAMWSSSWPPNVRCRPSPHPSANCRRPPYRLRPHPQRSERRARLLPRRSLPSRPRSARRRGLQR